MLQMSKIIRSRDEWKRKAVMRANELREFRKTNKHNQDKIAELKAQIKAMERASEEEKKTVKESSVVVDLQVQQVRALCIMLVLQTVVSYRSVPRIINLFKTRTELTLEWIPHFTSVINWTLRLGLGMLKQVHTIHKPWLAIIDHSIDIGTKKALVVLRVAIDALKHKNQAIQLKDCECIGLSVCETVNGKTISIELEKIFSQAGMPSAIIKDCDSTLAKGVKLWSEKQDTTIAVVDDIGHVMANALKAQFEKTTAYSRFTSLISRGANRLRQSELAFLIPPKLRSKGRFQRSVNLHLM